MTYKQLYQIMKDLKWNSKQYDYYKAEHAKCRDYSCFVNMEHYNSIIDGMLKVLNVLMSEDDVDKIVAWLEDKEEEPTLLSARRWWESHK